MWDFEGCWLVSLKTTTRKSGFDEKKNIVGIKSLFSKKTKFQIRIFPNSVLNDSFKKICRKYLWVSRIKEV